MKKFAILSTLGAYLLTPLRVFAQENGDETVVDTINLGPAQGEFGIGAGTSLNVIISNAITVVFVVAAILVLIMLIWGGIEWVLSGGDKEKVANARKRIIASLVGMALIALAFLIVRVVGEIFGFNVLGNLTIPALDKPIKTLSE